MIRRAAAQLPQPAPEALRRIEGLFAARGVPEVPDSLAVSFRDSTVVLRVGAAAIGACTLRGRIVLVADELRIDSACRLEHPLVCARKITVGSGARIAAQLFARDTLVVEPRARAGVPLGGVGGPLCRAGRPHDSRRIPHCTRHRAGTGR